MKLSLAYLQSPTRVDGVGGGITTLNVNRDGAKNCQALEATANGLLVTGEAGLQSLIPWANVKVASIEKNSETKHSTTK